MKALKNFTLIVLFSSILFQFSAMAQHIQGSVYSDGSPMPGISITLVSTDGSTVASIQTEPDGSFSYIDPLLDDGLYILIFGYPTIVSSQKIIITGASVTPAFVMVDLSDPQLIVSGSVTNLSCYDSNDGAIDISVTGGIEPYSFSWSDGNFDEDRTNIPSGSYTVTVIDSTGVSEIASFNVLEPDQIVIDGEVSNVTCPGLSDGSISITVSGGIEPYSFSWNNGSTDPNLESLSQGTYTITVTDSIGCIANRSFDITAPEYFGIASQISDVSCYGNDDGAIDLTVSGSTPPYTFEWSSGETTEDISDLSPGRYYFTVTDSNQCKATTYFDVNEPEELEIITDNVNNETCTECKDGSINITIVGGTPEYIFAWSGPDDFESTTEDQTQLGVGTYTLTVTDQNGCVKVETFKIENPLIVTNTNDAGFGSLRNAINYANSNAGRDSIVFNIQDEGTLTITPQSALPVISDPLVIDGYTQPGTAEATVSEPAILRIELDGINLIDDHYTSGLTIHSGNSTIRGLMINQFGDDGIHIADLGGNIIEGNYIGVDADGQAKGNYDGALRIWNSQDNIIGGDLAENRNVMASSGSHIIQILLPDAINNVIKGNYVGLAPDGNTKLGTSQTGVRINEGAHHNIIGPGNVISGHSLSGIVIAGGNPNNNSIIGNFIGTNAEGNVALPNGDHGISIINAPENTIGGINQGEKNLISGNIGDGIHIDGEGSVLNSIMGNYIGTSFDGTSALGNTSVGVNILNSKNNIIGGNNFSKRNLISGNSIGVNIAGVEADSNLVAGNFVGTDITGMSAIPNTNGVWIFEGNHNVIGGSDPESRNIISGNNDNGVWINGSINSPATGNRVLGNYVGLNASGTDIIGNHGFGIKIRESYGNIVGGSDPSDRNVVSGNGSVDPPRHGIHIEYDSSGIGNVVEGNYIGTDYTGNLDLGNNYIGIVMYYSSSNTIRNNLVSGNRDGIYVYKGSGEFNADSNIIQGNLIGTKYNGIEALGNEDDGIGIQGGRYNIIGGPNESDRNIISGNRIGIRILSSRCSDNTVNNNFIGTDITGMESLPNSEHGIYLYRGTENNIIGGITKEERNIISGNGNNGVYISENLTNDNRIIGNYIGTDVEGKNPLPNGQGINIDNAATGNIIGGSIKGAGNLVANSSGAGIGLSSYRNYVYGNEISGNGTDGIFITGDTNIVGGPGEYQRNFIYGNSNGIAIYPGSSFNRIEGNYIGTDSRGEEDLTEGWDGIGIGGSYNEIVSNLIVGYTHQGITLGRWTSEEVPNPNPVPEGNLVEDNIIGLGADGSSYIPNGHGISFNSAVDNRIIRNIIAGNTFNGILIGPDESVASVNNLISENSIYDNGELGIDLESGSFTLNDDQDIDNGPNYLQNYPVLDSLSFKPGYVSVGGLLNSTPGTEFKLQFFASKVGDNTAYGEGQTYIGTDSVTTDNTGDALFVSSFPIKSTAGQVITAVAIDPEGNTSEFSRSIGGVREHILSDINRPFYYHINSDGAPNIYNGSDILAIEKAFQSWTDVTTADINFESAGTTDSVYASSTDGINLVTFRDEKFPFAPGVLAVSAKTLKIDALSNTAEILDADIVFNPGFVNSIGFAFDVVDSPDDTLVFDIESVTAHEIGHALGLIHSGAPLSTMFFMLGTGTDLRSLENDDISWVSYRYPTSDYDNSFASISGRVTYGDKGDPTDPATHPPVAGALILAVDTLTKEQIHTYTDAEGMYRVPVPAIGSPVSYWIHVQPLDGDVFGLPLRPGNISSYIYSNTIYTDYRNEWYNGDNESAYDLVDTLNKATVIDLIAGDAITGINIITNKDDTQPYVVSVSPSATAYNDTVDVLSDIIIKFSEDVELKTFTEESCFLNDGEENYSGKYWTIGDKASIVFFTPESPMKFDTEYSLHLKATITDLKNNSLYIEDEVVCTFKTCEADTLKPFIKDIIPESGADSVFVLSQIYVFFSESMDISTSKDGINLIGPGNQLLAGDFIWTNYNRNLAFIPQNPLLEDTGYTLHLSTALKDNSGNGLIADSSIVFTTIPNAKPQVIYLGPKDNSVNVTLETPIVADFTEPVDISTITSESFSLKRSDGSSVTGKFEFMFDNSRVVLHPESSLAFDTQYFASLSTDIKDASVPALSLESNVTSGFTTASEQLAPTILYIDPPAGVVGSVIMIKGSGFDPNPINNTVTLNGINANVLKATLTDLAFKIPLGAISGDIVVTVNGVSSNSLFFEVLEQSLDPCEDVTANVNTGTRSRDVAITPDAGRALVTNPGSGTVSVIGLNLIDPVSNDPTIDIIENLSVGGMPLMIDIDAMGKFAYVTNYTTHTVDVIDLATYELKNIKVASNPYGVAVSPDGLVYVSHEYSGLISVIDVNPSSGGFDHVIANVNTGTRNREIDISPEAGLLLVAGDNGLTIINVNPDDIDYNSVIANVNTGTRTRDVDITPEAGLAIVTTESGDLFIVDIYPSSDTFGSVIANVNTGTRSRDIEISPDAMFVYITNEDGSVSVYKLSAGGSGSLNTSYRQVSLTLHAIIPAEAIGANELEGLVIDYAATKLYVVDPGGLTESGQLIEITICCGPVLPEKAVGNLLIYIQSMISSGTIDKGNANALLTKLYTALKKIDKGQNKVAINVLNAFIDLTEDLSLTGQIPAENADALIYSANAIIFNLESASYKSSSNIFDDYQDSMSGPGSLKKVFPNPFSELLSIYFEIGNNNLQDVDVNISIYNSAGQLVRILTDISLKGGDYLVTWDGRLEGGSPAKDYAYFVHFRAGDYSTIRKVILQRQY